ncbi:MAG: TonB family protein [Terracidiphilus sp.]
MRSVLVASLFLSTVLLNAQTATKGQSATLEARNESPNALSAPAAAPTGTDVSATTHPRPISTGVVAPKLISEPEIELATSDFQTEDLAGQYMVVHFWLDESGTPKNVQIVRPVNPTVDARMLAAVRQYHFLPATLDNQAVPLEMNLRIDFQAR